MLRHLFRAACLALAVLALAACGDSKEDILKKAENATTRQQLRDAIGDPDDISKIGPIETWTYNATNGVVTFTLAGNTVTLRATGAKEK